MNVFYEESGELKVASVLADNAQSLQVEAPHGKRSKIKASAVLLRFERPAAGELLQAAQALAADIDVELLWSACTPDAEVGFDLLAEDYMGHKPDPVEQAAVLICLYAAPMYFYRKGHGRFRPAPEANLRAALAGLERKRQQEIQKQEAIEAIRAGVLPAWLAEGLPALLYRPDKNTWAYKTLEAASAVLHLPIPQLLARCGTLRDSRAWHEGRFQFEYFGPLPADAQYPLAQDFSRWPLADAPAFSIDDAFTTEIDDAFSIAEGPEGCWQVGIHIAAPGLGFEPGSLLDALARERLSTVYMPGDKISMLPEQAIQAHTLLEGRATPALSLVLTVRKNDFEVVDRITRIERVFVEKNLRLHEVEPVFDPLQEEGSHPFHERLRLLWRLADQLANRRGVKDRPPQRYYDFNFVVEGERVTITERPRGSPLDTLVSELMIEVNSSWGGTLAAAGIPALYRTQVNGKTGLSSEPAPHQGLGVAQYAWSSSPLRRYVDLVNQWQLIRFVGGAPPCFAAEGSELFSIARTFEMAYEAYAEFQRSMERYWCLRWLQQEQVRTTDAMMLREGSARLAGLPLVVKVHGAGHLPAGTLVRLAVERLDLWELTLVCQLEQVLEPLAEVASP
ncbi:MAG: RNB domain-containing ribonuclease [Betaproteobacteria bacterium]|nr:RNB domain-containing ribonuclease [Betaproteobacteria bacterium]